MADAKQIAVCVCAYLSVQQAVLWMDTQFKAKQRQNAGFPLFLLKYPKNREDFMAEHIMHKKETKKTPQKSLKEKREEKKAKKKGKEQA
jgi:D-lyxose ketol-isomerase